MNHAKTTLNARVFEALGLALVMGIGAACSSEPGSSSGPGPMGASGGSSGASGSSGAPVSPGDAPELAITSFCEGPNRTPSGAGGAPLAATWMLSKACVERDLLSVSSTGTLTPVAVAGNAKGKWVFDATTLQRTVQWKVTVTATMTRYDNTTCAAQGAILERNMPTRTLPQKDESKPITCSDGGVTNECTCLVHLASDFGRGPEGAFDYVDPNPVGYLVNAAGVNLGGNENLLFSVTGDLLTTSRAGIQLAFRRQ